jgi:ketosteroid isomerase-like protein
MKKYWLISLGVLLFLVSANVAEAQKTSASVNTASEVQQTFNQLVAASNARDAKAIVSFLAADVVLVSPLHSDYDLKMFNEDLTKRYAAPANEPFTVKGTVEEIQVSGNLAFVRAVWSHERISDHSILAGEKEVAMWERQKNGAWRLARSYSFPLKLDAPNWTSSKVSAPRQQTTKKTDTAADIEAIKQALAQTALAYNNRDLPLRMSFYAADSLLSYPGQPDADIQRTKQNYGENFANLPPFPFRSFYEIEEIQASGDLAFVQMMWFVERQSDKQIVSRLKDLEIWQRQADGRWKLARGLSFHLKPDAR